MTDKQLIKTVKAFVKGVLGKREPDGMCATVSYPLEGYLGLCGIQCRIVQGEIRVDEDIYTHVWIELEDKRILDGTASQFNVLLGIDMPLVYLGEKPEWYIVPEIKITDFMRKLTSNVESILDTRPLKQ